MPSRDYDEQKIYILIDKFLCNLQKYKSFLFYKKMAKKNTIHKKGNKINSNLANAL